jgi:hypothetical protein
VAVSRRQVLQLGLLTAAAAASRPLGASAQSGFPMSLASRRTGPSVLQGATDETRTQFSIVHNVKETYAFRVTTDRGGKWKPDRIETLKLEGQPTAILPKFGRTSSHKGPTSSFLSATVFTAITETRKTRASSDSGDDSRKPARRSRFILADN